eukprot:213032-Alexandrium_andersonii.AAC.1
MDFGTGFWDLNDFDDRASALKVNASIVEASLFKTLESISGKKPEQDATTTQKAVDLLNAAKGSVPQDL